MSEIKKKSIILQNKGGVSHIILNQPDKHNALSPTMIEELSDGVATLTIYWPDKKFFQSKGIVEGTISEKPKGKNGFGYDPIFEVSGLGETFAEMSCHQKKQMGHRGNAFKLLKPELEKLFTSMD